MAVLALHEDLANALLALSLLPGVFSAQLAAELLVLQESRALHGGLIRRLVDRALLQHNSSRQRYPMHPVVREVRLPAASRLLLLLPPAVLSKRMQPAGRPPAACPGRLQAAPRALPPSPLTCPSSH